MIIEYCYFPSPLGLILLATEHSQLCWLSISTEKTEQESHLLWALQQAHPNIELQHNPQAAKSYIKAMNGYFQGQALPTDIALCLKGTPWQQQVWQTLRQIPHGTTISYTDLAHQCNKPQGARAAANACGQNNIALFVPCHRVVAKSGALTGYKWGVDNKEWLLKWEKPNA